MAEAWKRFLFWLSATRFGGWLTRTFFEPLDPMIYRLTGGRFTAAGPAVIPMLVLTTTGRKSGKPRSVQLVYTVVDDEVHIVASNFGGEKHPAWSYNLEADSKAQVQIGSRAFDATAVRLADADKDRIWNELVAQIPNFRVYKQRTDRNIRVYRIDEDGSASAAS